MEKLSKQKSLHPRVSVVMTVYKGEKILKRSIPSVFSQTFTDFEFITIVDGSPDNSIQELQKYRDPRIRILVNETNLGRAKASNRAIRAARGEYIARIDQDDIWCDREKLAKQVRFLDNNPDYVLVGGAMIVVDRGDKEIFRALLPESDEKIRRVMLFDNPFVHSSLMFRKEAWERVGGYDEEIIFPDDYDLWLKLGTVGKVYNFPEYFVWYLQDVGQNTSNINIVNNLKQVIPLRVRYRNDYPGFWKAYLLGWCYYFYRALKIPKIFRHALLKIRTLVFSRDLPYKHHY